MKMVSESHFHFSLADMYNGKILSYMNTQSVIFDFSSKSLKP